MTVESITLGPTPCGESCAQVGQEGYEAQAWRECRAYKAQLNRIAAAWLTERHLVCPASFSLKIKSYPHEFGSYHEVSAIFNSEDKQAVELAYYLEGDGAPLHWDKDALAELGL